MLQGNRQMKDKNDSKTIDAFKAVAKTNAERQREYRQRQSAALNSLESYQDGGKRLDTYISGDAALNLDSLIKYFSLHGNITKKQLIEKLINEEYMRHIKEITDIELKK